MASPAQVEIHEAAPWRCAPCNQSRCGAAPTPLFILVLIALNYIPVVIFGISFRNDAGSITAAVLFHIALAFTILSWVYTCCTDPGVAPEAWQRQMAQEVANGRDVPVCRRSGLYKPPRSHFDSVTERLTLNMDHFCPWVVNTVGFYNRKFFMLFLIYANLTLFIALVILAAYLPTLWPWLMDEQSGGAAPNGRFFPGIVNILILLAALGVDALMLFGILGPFMLFHLQMAARNESTIEGHTNPHYDVGRMDNLRSVFGREMWTWPIPLYLRGPQGDGLHWPRSDQPPHATGTRTSNAISSSGCGGSRSSEQQMVSTGAQKQAAAQHKPNLATTSLDDAEAGRSASVPPSSTAPGPVAELGASPEDAADQSEAKT